MVTSRQAPAGVRGIRLPHAGLRARSPALLAAPGSHDVVLVPLPVEPLGRRCADAPPLEETLELMQALRTSGVLAAALLDHAGPSAALWARERPRGPSDVPEPRTGRRPQALDESAWSGLIAAYAAAAARCAARGIPCVLGMDDDGLLHAALSPLTAGDREGSARLARALRVHEAVSQACGRAVDAALVVEELCPQGLDATDGIAAATALAARGVRRIYASAGTVALPALRRRRKGGNARGAEHALHSAAWLTGMPAEIVAVLPLVDEASLGRARSLGMVGVVRQVFEDELADVGASHEDVAR